MVASYSATAQDIHFSQFYMSPLNLNPALTGVMDCNARLTVNYRNQWSSILKSNAFNTFSASYDAKIPVGRYDYFGVGGTLWADKAGSAGFHTYTGKISGSYSKQMASGRGSSHYLSIGAELGGAQRGVDGTKLRWGNQYSNGTFNESITGETLDRENFFFMDMAVGLLWFSVLDDNTNFYIGGAYHHLNQPDVSFFDNGNEPQFTKITAHAGGEIGVSRNFVVVPGALVFLQGPLFQLNAGTNIRFLLGDNQSYQSFDLGVWTRLSNRLDDGIHADALILSARFDYNNVGVGLSYDLNISELSAASRGNGAFELSAFYKVCGSERRNVYCPKF